MRGNAAGSRSRTNWRVASKSGEGTSGNGGRTADHSCNPPTIETPIRERNEEGRIKPDLYKD
jgi:hypothetical protein